MQPGDIITRFDGQNIANATDLLAAIRKKEPGKQSVIGFQRGKETKSTTATLGSTAQR
ncbi:PDZ domain-containing protein [Paenarthrobacter sp. JL.01a]|uniref:PDZ domain-containing protein n=1 Tax=Paenarthrobacter sp. JL.01a TaxID=2979324 RepID=UPI0039659C4F